MGKFVKSAASADLFDQGSNSQPGERQSSFDEYWGGSISASVAKKAAQADAYFAAKDEAWRNGWNASKGQASL